MRHRVAHGNINEWSYHLQARPQNVECRLKAGLSCLTLGLKVHKGQKAFLREIFCACLLNLTQIFLPLTKMLDRIQKDSRCFEGAFSERPDSVVRSVSRTVSNNKRKSGSVLQHVRSSLPSSLDPVLRSYGSYSRSHVACLCI